MEHNIPYRDASGGGSNPAIAGLLLSARMRSLMYERAEIAQALYREIVSKRTGRLARSARVETFIGGARNDRWCSRLIVGGAEAPHGLAHEFGYEIDRDDEPIQVEGAHDLNLVLNAMGALL
ncbi:hypothetical protein IU469_22260 [Nocardia puris]|uniref:hypothetical protein n=1 Tax=Nocardia puris TaxID=208602 RepID=UPI0018950166|nr:hypothetical protein [Nocardia puris]MBF6368424.1 hypothetical protein [Nocardia puris]